MLCFSVAQSPKSMSLQRLLQNGLCSLLSSQTTGVSQVGQLTVLGVFIFRAEFQVFLMQAGYSLGQ